MTIQTTVYVVVKLELEHESDVNPLDVVNECDYDFVVPYNILGTIRHTEIVAQTDNAKDVGL